MESRPPQDSPRRPTNGSRKPNGSGGPPTPPWLWLLLVAGFGVIFWLFAPKGDTSVLYQPWFLDQVDRDNIKSLTQGRMCTASSAGDRTAQREHRKKIKKFSTYIPSDAR